jgi:hypothetical protein
MAGISGDPGPFIEANEEAFDGRNQRDLTGEGFHCGGLRRDFRTRVEDDLTGGSSLSAGKRGRWVPIRVIGSLGHGPHLALG